MRLPILNLHPLPPPAFSILSALPIPVDAVLLDLYSWGLGVLCTG